MLLWRLGYVKENTSRNFLFLGAIVYLCSMILSLFGSGIYVLSFLEGMLEGMATVFFITGLAFLGISRRKLKNGAKENSDHNE